MILKIRGMLLTLHQSHPPLPPPTYVVAPSVCPVTRADVLQDGQGRSKGCGLVEFKTAAQARNAILTLNNTDLDGRQIFIREVRSEGRFGGGGLLGSCWVGWVVG